MLILLDNKKPAKPYDLRVFVFLCTALNLDLVPRAGIEVIYKHLINSQIIYLKLKMARIVARFQVLP